MRGRGLRRGGERRAGGDQPHQHAERDHASTATTLSQRAKIAQAWF
ncbi:MAG TPA: hypothetical protein VHX88_03025 [Solirubrobacteraceae bacterium]|nr:hypothetical protein [Solirubrobacteraceae bacterium]